MLPSTKRLSRSYFTTFLDSSGLKTVFNTLGTLKYKEAPHQKVSVVISSKHEKRAVFRNKLRRRLYTLFRQGIKVPNSHSLECVLYTSKQAPKLDYGQIKTLFNELIDKTTK